MKLQEILSKAQTCLQVFFVGMLGLVSFGCVPANSLPTVTPESPKIQATTSSTFIPLHSTITFAPIYPTSTAVCFNDLSFIQDLTIPDFSVVSPASILDKQWLVTNSGTCNWDSRYRIRLIYGKAFGDSMEKALFPARAGEQIPIQITFTAPDQPGVFFSEWQAYDAEGISFGDSFFIKIVVR